MSEELIAALSRALGTYERNIKRGSVYVGKGWPCWLYDTQARLFHRGGESARIQVSALKDQTLTFADGNRELRRLPDGEWLTRLLPDREWKALS